VRRFNRGDLRDDDETVDVGRLGVITGVVMTELQSSVRVDETLEIAGASIALNLSKSLKSNEGICKVDNLLDLVDVTFLADFLPFSR
jgi:hypothetical protein